MSPASNGSGWREHLLLLSRFLRHPRAVGAIAPSSPSLARAMVQHLDLNGSVRVVELGPGTGAFTWAIVSLLGPSARCLAIDRDPVFVEQIKRRWPRVDCVCASAAALPELAAERSMTPVDHVVSGLPFASLPATVTTGILDGLERTLRPGGTFTTFQYVHAYRLPPAVAFRRDINRRMGGTPVRSIVMRNLPPAYVLTWQRA
jgi:phosphatidylethanolamine/phosphatidyl-N-methylethanolamine N-methyltransferase